MPVVPNFLERLVLLQLNQGPGPLLDFLGGQAFRAALAGLRLGVFQALKDGPLTPAEVAHQIGADERGTSLLLEGLEALGYVKKRDDRYASTAMTVKWLPLLGQGANFFERVLFDNWGHLEESIRQGRPVTPDYENPAAQRDFQAGMIAISRGTADETVARVKLPSAARRLLDVGGGHGLYSILFCHRYHQLSATVFDSSVEALNMARETIAAEQVDGRVSTKQGDFWQDDLGSGYDVALLFNIVHSHLPDKNIELLRKISGALGPGGVLVVMDQIAGTGATPVAKAVARMQALNMYLSAGGQTYPFGEIERWFAASGFNSTKRISLRRTPGMGLIVGTKAG